MIDEILKAGPSIIQAISIAVTAYFAVRTLKAWRIQLVGKRRFEIAEQTIVAVHRATEALAWIRTGMSFSGEASERPKVAGEKDSEARQRDSYFVTLKRMKDTANDFAELSKVRLLCKIHFGDDALKQIDVLFQARNEVRLAAEALLDSVGAYDTTLNSAFYADCKRKIWARNDESDKIFADVSVAAKTIEELLSPSLR